MIPAEAAHDTIAALGEVGMLQFKDLNADRTAFQRTYANQVGRRQALSDLITVGRWGVPPAQPHAFALAGGVAASNCSPGGLPPVQIKRCDEMARQLRFFTSEVEKAGILVAPRLSADQVCLVLHCTPTGRSTGMAPFLLNLSSFFATVDAATCAGA